ncbi:angio-associated migratory cell protein-like isoform X2 [Saccostrea cucullata]|uniref:angio-associated migratory cell protein-like isoform X1 n=1 Tax=Saccostrea cuccullata TaxID=36930 RepID=UPI002ED29687
MDPEQEEVEVIEIDENEPVPDEDDDDEGGDLSADINEMDLENEIQYDSDEIDDEATYRDDATFVYKKHADSVFTARIDSKTSDLVITGGQDDTAYVWSASSGETKFQCDGHKDSVTCVGFSHDGVYAASADLSGLVKVWKVDTGKEVWSFECSDIEWMQWHQIAHVLIVGTQDGDTWMWKIPSGDCKTFQGHGSSSGSGCLLPDGKRMCVGYEDGTVKVWDMKTATCLHHLNGKDIHTSSVVCVDCHQDNNLILTGSTDATAKVIHSTTGKVVTTFNCAEENSEEENSVESCAFSDSQSSLAATGTLTGKLIIWDVPTQTNRNTCEHIGGVVKVKWDTASPLVYTACLDGVIRLWDARNGKCSSEWVGHQDALLDFDLSNDGKTLVSVSEDNTARVFSLHKPDS